MIFLLLRRIMKIALFINYSTDFFSFSLDYSKKRNSNEQVSSSYNSNRQFQDPTEQTAPSLPVRQISDEVFVIPDTPVSNEDENQQLTNNQEDASPIIRQKSRNWADCPIDESVVDTPTSPPVNINNVSPRNDIEDYQVGHRLIFRNIQ